MSDSHADCSDHPRGFGATWKAEGSTAASSGLENGSLKAGSSGRAAGRAMAAMVVDVNGRTSVSLYTLSLGAPYSTRTTT